MAEIGLMIEGQNGLNWARWRGMLEAAERLGFQCVFRSDHFTNPRPPDKDSLELWTSLTFAATETRRVEFGPLVTPVTFRHPAVTARIAAAVDDLSGGRLVLGIGAGWQEREHHNFGVPFPQAPVRYEMLDEYLQVVTLLLRSDEPVTLEGKHYQLHDAILLPRPTRPGGPPILVGGNGERRTLPLVARYADEWNALFLSPEELRRLCARLDSLLEAEGRRPDAVKRSTMMGAIFARDEAALRETLSQRGRTLEEVMWSGQIVGTPQMWVEQLSAYIDAGIERFMLQWLDLDDLEGLEAVAQEVLPALADAAS